MGFGSSNYSATMLHTYFSICTVLFILLTTNYLWFQPIRIAYAFGSENDHSALLNFKESIIEDPFRVLISWNSSSHFCNWPGVKCSHQHQRVIVLNLTGYHLHGLLSPHIGNLSFLRVLLLNGNSFYGTVPQELGHLFQLQMLSLSNNTLEGEFPINLTNCSELRVLNLKGNRFIGEIPKEIESLGKLEKLRISRNNLTGQIPPSLGNLSSLAILSMGYNNLKGQIPEEIGHLKNLERIDVRFNKLSGMLPSSFYNLSSLISISIVANQFNGSLLANMFLTLPNLKHFSIGANQFSGSIPTSITNASRIQIFSVYHNHFIGQVPSLEKARDISILQLDSNNLGSNSTSDLQFLKSLTNCSQLSTLGISYNNFGGPFPNFVGNFSTQLTQLYLGGNHISGKIPTEFGNLVHLIVLGLERNHLTGIIPTTLGKLQKLQLLSLTGNKLSREIPTFIGNLTRLYLLDLSYNMLIGNVPSTIGNCIKLEHLDLSHNNLSGAIPSQIFEIFSLSILLDVSNNALSGNLPMEVGMLNNIEKLKISDNHFSGLIPETIGKCITLEYLYLEGNSFHGSIQPSLASLKGLRELDLSRNNLSGSIPEILQNISVLEYFNASFNKLEGEVPTNGVFHNASAISVIGNAELCGGVSELKLPPCPLKAMKRRKQHNLKQIMTILCLAVFLPILSCILALCLLRKKDQKSSTISSIDLLPKVSYQDLHHATNGFSVSNLIGKGSYGSVYKGILYSTERFVAIKVLNLANAEAHKSFIAECNAFKTIQHRNIVKIVTCCSSVDYNGNDFNALVFEFMSNCSLQEWLHPDNGSANRPRTLKLKTRLEIIVSVASALYYLHYECEEPIIHCDLKPSNILLDDEMVAHVSDFGLAKFLSTSYRNFHNQSSTRGIKGTSGYAPPEYGASSQVSTKGDVYSFGILMLEILTRRRPTEEMFKDGYNLHNYVKMALPNNIFKIVDATLLLMENEYPPITIVKENNLCERSNHMHPNVKKCLLSLFRIGLACSMDSPRERIDMMEVTRELNMIRNAFYG